MPKQTLKRQPAPNIASITYWRKFAVHRVFYVGLALLFGLSAVAYFGSPRGGGPSGASQRGESVIAVVNDEPIKRAVYETQWERTRQQMQQMRRFGGQEMTEISAAQQQGRILDQLVRRAVKIAAAKRRNLTVTDADIDKEIHDVEKSGPNGKPMSDDEFDKLLQGQGTSLAEVREQMHEDLLPVKLEDHIADQQKVTEGDLLKTYDKLKVRRILIPVTGGTQPSPKALPDAQAKQRAEKILADLKGGADFTKEADQFSADPSNQRTDTDPKTKKPVTHHNGGLLNADTGGWYTRGEGQSGQSKEFDNAAFNLKPGQMSDVVKTPEGYQIIKVEDYKRELPKDYAKNKADLLKEERQKRAAKPLQELVDAERKAAKIEWRDSALEWRYKYAQLPGMMMNVMAGPDDKAREAFLNELRDYTKKNKDDGVAFLVLGQMLDNKLMVATTKPTSFAPGERQKIQDEAIAAYEAALAKTEDRQTRFRLADLYMERGKSDLALKQYQKIMTLLSFDDDPNNRFTYTQLAGSFSRLGRQDLSQQAQKKFEELTQKFQEQQKKEEAARKAEAEKAASVKPSTGKGGGGTVNVTPGGTATVKPATGPSASEPTKPAADHKPAVEDKKPEPANGAGSKAPSGKQ